MNPILFGTVFGVDLKKCMKAKITYRFPIGPVDSNKIEYTIIKEITTKNI